MRACLLQVLDRLGVSCFNYLQQVCKYEVISSLIPQTWCNLMKSMVLVQFDDKPVADTRGGGRRGAQAPPPIIFTEALVLKSGSTRKFLF